MNVLNAEQFALLNGLEIEEVSEFFKGLDFRKEQE